MSRYLLEIGVEEFPAKYIKSTQRQLVDGMEKLLEENKYTYDEIKINSTPRRFALLVEGIRASESNLSEKVKGPSKKIAFDENNQPTKALKGFMRSKGLELEDILIEEINGEEYIFGNIETKLIPIDQVLSEGVPDIIRHVSNPKSMRWGGKNLRFLRPIRWIVSLLDDEILDFDLEGIKVGNTTKGHRTLGSSEIEINSIDEYQDKLEENYVILDEDKRRNMIVRGINRLSKEKGGNYIHDEDLLDEVVNINEYPTTFIGEFDKDYLNLPKEVIVTPMKDHQRYFPIEDDQHNLLPYFISVRNGDKKGLENVVEGNEKVLMARLEDAKFFYDQDVSKDLEDYVEEVEKLGFHEGLGSMKDKAERLEKLVKTIGKQLNVGEEAIELAQRAAYLSKADLVTKTVIEFTELQGIMGRIYALKSGENKIVAKAIEEQYKPTHAGGELPKTTSGILLSLADKIDSLSGLYSIGVEVTGSQDPYGLRRAVLGILRILIENKMNMDLVVAIKDALYNYVEDFGQTFDYDQVVEKTSEFIRLRLRNMLLDEGYRHDVIDSIIGQKKLDVYEIYDKVVVVTRLMARDDSDEIITKFIRIANISKDAKSLEVDEDLLLDDDGKIYELLPALEEIDRRIDENNFSDSLEKLIPMADILDQYLDTTMINVDDEDIKNNRLALVKNVSARIERIFKPTEIVRD